MVSLEHLHGELDRVDIAGKQRPEFKLSTVLVDDILADFQAQLIFTAVFRIFLLHLFLYVSFETQIVKYNGQTAIAVFIRDMTPEVILKQNQFKV